jgi:hypothetical protein
LTLKKTLLKKEMLLIISEILLKDGSILKIEALVSTNPRILHDGKIYLSISAWDSLGRDGKRLYRNVYACE